MTGPNPVQVTNLNLHDGQVNRSKNMKKILNEVLNKELKDFKGTAILCPDYFGGDLGLCGNTTLVVVRGKGTILFTEQNINNDDMKTIVMDAYAVQRGNVPFRWACIKIA